MVKADTSSVQDVLSSTGTGYFDIPIYQRPYSWETEQLDHFWSDLDKAREKQENHFFGLVVFCQTNAVRNRMSFDVIDGQQRLTTLSIMLAVIRDYCTDILASDGLSYHQREDLSDWIRPLNDCLLLRESPTKKELRLRTNIRGKHEREVLNVILSELRSVQKDYPAFEYAKDASGKYPSIWSYKLSVLESSHFDKRSIKGKKSLKAAHFFVSKINDLTEKKNQDEKIKIYLDLGSVLLERFQLIPFVLSSPSEAFNLFETLNHRGLKVAALDLMKNLVLSKSGGSMDQIFEQWQGIFDDTLKKSDGVQLLRYSYNISHGFVQASSLYNSYRSKFESLTPDSISRELRQIGIDAEHYEELQFGALANLVPQLKSKILLLRATKSKQWLYIGINAMRLLKLHPGVADGVLQVFDSLVRLVATIKIKGFAFNMIEQQFPELSRKMRLADGATESECRMALADVNTGIIKFSKQKKLLVEVEDISEREFSDNQTAKMVLLILMHSIRNHHFEIREDMTLEHVFPTKPKVPWEGFVEPDEVNYCNLIGNFLLLSGSMNASVSNGGFEAKKQSYITENVYDHLSVMNADLVATKVDKWTPELISERSRLIAGFLQPHIAVFNPSEVQSDLFLD